MYKCMVVDDDAISRLAIKNLVKIHPELTLVHSAENAHEAEVFLEENEIDLVFLDVLMPDKTGFEFLRELKKNLKVILISEYREFALDAFSFEVIDYLKKPITGQRFNAAIDKFIKQTAREKAHTVSQETGKQASKNLFIKVEGIFRKVPIKDIIYLENEGNYVKICTNAGILTPYGTIKEIENKLPENSFIRPHRKYLVAIEYVNGIDENFIITDKKLIPISRDKRRLVYQAFGL